MKEGRNDGLDSVSVIRPGSCGALLWIPGSPVTLGQLAMALHPVDSGELSSTWVAPWGLPSLISRVYLPFMSHWSQHGGYTELASRTLMKSHFGKYIFT